MSAMTTIFDAIRTEVRALFGFANRQPALDDLSHAAAPMPSDIEQAFSRVDANTNNDFERLTGYVEAIAQLHKARIIYQKTCINDLKRIVTELQEATDKGWKDSFDHRVGYSLPEYTKGVLEAFDVRDIINSVIVRALQSAFQHIEGKEDPSFALPTGNGNGKLVDLLQRITNSEYIENPVDGLMHIVYAIEQGCDAKDQAYSNLVIQTQTHIAELQVAKRACWVNQESYNAAKILVIDDFAQLCLSAHVNQWHMQSCINEAQAACKTQTQKMQTKLSNKRSELAFAEYTKQRGPIS